MKYDDSARHILNRGGSMQNWKVLGLFIIAISVLFMIVYGTPWAVVKAQRESNLFLEERYGESFKVGLPRFWIMDGNYHAEAYPVARPDVKFSVGTEQGEEGIQDNYVWMSWRYEGKQAITDITSKYYDSKNVFIEVDPTPRTGNTELYAFEKHTNLEVIISLNNEMLTSKAKETSKIHQILMEIRDKEIPIKNLVVGFNDEVFRINVSELTPMKSEEELMGYWKTNQFE